MPVLFFEFPGGVVYPIVFWALFARNWLRLGCPNFRACQWCFMHNSLRWWVSSLCGQKKPGPYLDIKTIADTRFALLAIGSRLVTLGEFNSKHSRYLIISLPSFRWTNPHLEVRIGDYEDVTKVFGCSGKVKKINGLKSGKYLNRVSIGISIMNLNPPFLPLILAKFASLCRREVEVWMVTICDEVVLPDRWSIFNLFFQTCGHARYHGPGMWRERRDKILGKGDRPQKVAKDFPKSADPSLVSTPFEEIFAHKWTLWHVAHVYASGSCLLKYSYTGVGNC